jgi:hypothetical protein
MVYPNAYGTHPEWPYETEKTAAKRLGVGVELVRGLCSQGHIEAFYTTGKSGNPLWLVRRSEIPALAARMAAVTSKRAR